MRFTEGTWKNIGERIIVTDKPGFTPTPAHPEYVIAQCRVHCSPDYEEAKSNANLMAASKEMYKALLHARAILASAPGETETLLIIQAAILKAEGK